MKKKNFKPFSKKRSLDISLQHKNRASNKFSKKKKFCTWPKIGLQLKGLSYRAVLFHFILFYFILFYLFIFFFWQKTDFFPRAKEIGLSQKVSKM